MSSASILSEFKLEMGRQRYAQKLTYDELAKLSGVSRRTLIAVETGSSSGSIETWLDICHGLQCAFSDFVATCLEADSQACAEMTPQSSRLDK